LLRRGASRGVKLVAQESAAFKQRARELGGINKGEKGVHRLSATKRLYRGGSPQIRHKGEL